MFFLLPFEYKDLGEFRSRSPLKREIKSEGIAIPQSEETGHPQSDTM